VLPNNEYVTVALSVAPDRATLYLIDINGLHQAVNVAPHAVQPFESYSHLAWNNGLNARRFTGTLGDVHIFKQTLTAAQIEALHQERFNSLQNDDNRITRTVFSGLNFDSHLRHTLDFDIQFEVYEGHPEYQSLQGDYSLRWTGCLLPAETRLQTFEADATGPVALWINGQQIFNRTLANATDPATGSIFLRKNVPASIRLEYKHPAGSPSKCFLKWFQSGSMLNIPASNFLPNESSMYQTAPPLPAALQLALNSLPDIHESLKVKTTTAGIVEVNYTVPTGTGPYCTLECSTDLQKWRPVPTAQFTTGGLGKPERIRMPLAVGPDKACFFRVRVSQ
jgi:hypothetical protein